MIDETFDYKGYHVQRLTKDRLWYVAFENKFDQLPYINQIVDVREKIKGVINEGIC